MIQIYIIELDGSKLYLTVDEAKQYLEDTAYSEDYSKYSIQLTTMSAEEFLALPEFEGF